MREARRLLAQHAFDVLILEVRLGGGKGFGLIAITKLDDSSIEIIVHSTRDVEMHVRRAFRGCYFGLSGQDRLPPKFHAVTRQLSTGLRGCRRRGARATLMWIGIFRSFTLRFPVGA